MVKYLDLKKINDSFEPELSEAVARVVRSGWYLFGKEVETFEQRFARYCGTKYCVGDGERTGCPYAYLYGLCQYGADEGRRRSHRAGKYLHSFHIGGHACRTQTGVLRA